MAKNLKLTIKNTQLAEALKLGKAAKPAAAAKKKKPAEETSTPVAKEKAVAEPVIEKVEPAAAAPTPAPEAAPKENENIAAEHVPPQPTPPPAAAVEKKIAEPTPKTPEVKAPSSSPRPPVSHQETPSYPRRQESYQQPRPSSSPSTGYTPRPSSGAGTSRPPSHPPRGDYRPVEPQRRFQPLVKDEVAKTPPPKPAPAAASQTPASQAEEVKRKQEPPKEFKEFRDFKAPKRGEHQAFDSRDRQGLRDSDEKEWRKRRPKQRSIVQEEVVIRPKQLKVRIPITVKDLASEMKLKASQLISKLFMQGVVITLNDFLDDETTIQLLGHEFECQIDIDTTEEKRIRITEKTIKQEIQESNPEHLVIRPPVVTFMGHVDHGKTSLIDAIRKTNVASSEAGAITQHIGAFKCHTAVGDITILDTPGHEAFSSMRERGADVTDIVVLVVAGDEGIRAQTIEAIKQAQDAQVPLVVALNKSDKPNFNAENVYRQLADNNLLPEVWGGSIITVNCSAVTREGISSLLEMLALQAEILELKADPKARARGAVIESEMHKGLGAVATLLVQNGTLRLGDAIVFAQHWARVKTMHDEKGKEMLEAGPSTPVKITGLSGIPDAGSEFIVVKTEAEARDLSHQRTLGHKQTTLLQTKRASFENLVQQKQAEKKVLTLILKADVQGSLEALKASLLKIESNKVELNVISSAVGEISESDIQLAAASKATIIGFHTQVEMRAERLIKELKVTVKLHDIIYHAVDNVKLIMKGLLDKLPQETDKGVAEVKSLFKASQVGLIAGCQVTEGTIQRNHHIRVLRGKEIAWKGPIASLKRFKEDVREVSKGYECGILLQNYNELKEGDLLQAYEITYLEQEI